MWKKINGAHNYEVNELGEVRSIDRVKTQWNGFSFCKVTYKGTILKPKLIRGYENVSIIYDDGTRKTKQVHRLVMKTLNPVENMKQLQVNHKNGVKNDNALENLEWCTCKENIIHSHATGLIKNKRNQNGEKNNLSKLTDEKVTEIVKLINNGVRNPDIAKLYGVKENTISKIRRGHTWKHIPRV